LVEKAVQKVYTGKSVFEGHSTNSTKRTPFRRKHKKAMPKRPVAADRTCERQADYRERAQRWRWIRKSEKKAWKETCLHRGKRAEYGTRQAGGGPEA